LDIGHAKTTRVFGECTPAQKAGIKPLLVPAWLREAELSGDDLSARALIAARLGATTEIDLTRQIGFR
jgi:hypothetical protein